MTDTRPARTWNSVCGDCVHCICGRCSAGMKTTGCSDCIAAICLAFQAKQEKGDA